MNSAGTGVYSVPLPFETPNSEYIFVCPTGVYVSMNGDIIPNHHGYLMIDDIGSIDATALLCNTNRPPHDYGDSGGNWFTPDGTAVGHSDNNAVPGLVRNRAPNVVRLLRNTATDAAAEGIYWCSIWDADGKHELVYVGLYNTGNGSC